GRGRVPGPLPQPGSAWLASGCAGAPASTAQDLPRLPCPAAHTGRSWTRHSGNAVAAQNSQTAGPRPAGHPAHATHGYRCPDRSGDGGTRCQTGAYQPKCIQSGPGQHSCVVAASWLPCRCGTPLWLLLLLVTCSDRWRLLYTPPIIIEHPTALRSLDQD